MVAVVVMVVVVVLLHAGGAGGVDVILHTLRGCLTRGCVFGASVRLLILTNLQDMAQQEWSVVNFGICMRLYL